MLPNSHNTVFTKSVSFAVYMAVYGKHNDAHIHAYVPQIVPLDTK